MSETWTIEERGLVNTPLNPPTPAESLALVDRLLNGISALWVAAEEQVTVLHLHPADLARLALCGADVPEVHVYGGQVVGIEHPNTGAVIAWQYAPDVSEGAVRYECVERSG